MKLETRKFNINDNIGITLTGLATLVIVAIIVVILGTLIAGGYKAISWEFLSQPPREGMTKGGIFPAIVGMFLSTLIMTVAVLPIGILSAVYLHEYAKTGSWMTKLVRRAVNNLAGVPSIVFGLFGLGFFIQFIGQGLDKSLGMDSVFGQPCILWASLTLALMNLPVMIVATEEALRAVPQAERAGSLALGATKWETIRRIVLPQALPGILTGIVLVISRGAGEVAPVMFTGAAYYLATLPKVPTDQYMTLGYHIFVMSTQSPDIDATVPIAMGATLVLLFLTLSLNLTAVVIRTRTRRNIRQENNFMSETENRIEFAGFSLFYGQTKGLESISFGIPTNRVTAIIGPSGCGKSTLLRAINRMNDLIDNVRVEGSLLIDDEDINQKYIDVVSLRRKVGMVFQKPNPFPKSIYDNVAYGVTISGNREMNKRLDEIVENSLKEAAIWDEVKDRLNRSALELSGGQQQRVCIARALAVRPEVILMDEPASALDPLATAKIEELIFRLKEKYTIVIVTHNMQQAARVSDKTAFLMLGKLVEYDDTINIFTNPSNKMTEEYITGRFG